MCGIFGVVGRSDAVETVLGGLRRLEYRGYDSGGVAVLNGKGVVIRKRVGRLDNLARSLGEQPIHGSVGIGHTRWATHGAPSDENAHPHTDETGRIAVVHNGIIENYHELREGLMAEGHHFESETDTEVLAHLVGQSLNGGDPALEMREALREVEGSYAIAVLLRDGSDSVLVARKDSPLVLGLADDGATYVASDVSALLEHTRRVCFLEDGQVAVIGRDGVDLRDAEGGAVAPSVTEIDWSVEDAEKSGYDHFMLKEIHEQPRALRETLRGRLDPETGDVDLSAEVPLSAEAARTLRRVIVVACGTSYHAGLVARHQIEEAARVPVDVDIASEFRYRTRLLDEPALVVVVSQSGETADTLAALRAVKEDGVRTLGIVNVVGSAIAREADGVLFTRAGPEIGVASTKAFTTQLAALHLLALHLGKLRGTLTPDEVRARGKELARVPSLAEDALEHREEWERTAGRFAAARDFLYLGRGLQHPIALEGALKLKEISYIHAEGYAAGEMKHGPIALIDRNMPVVAVATRGRLRDKVLSNVQEAAARGARVVVVAEDELDAGALGAEDILRVPAAEEHVSPIVNVLPLQIVAYHIAKLRNCDIDKPRNLAKSVTVE
jgi:glucosamine--fructose-6-phosphate aminotransferase (isomerizing)